MRWALTVVIKVEGDVDNFWLGTSDLLTMMLFVDCNIFLKEKQTYCRVYVIWLTL